PLVRTLTTLLHSPPVSVFSPMASGHFQVEAALLMLPLVMLVLNSGGGSAAGAVVPAVIVFGDSTVDTGNNNQIGTTLRSDFPPYGRDMPGGARATGRFGNGRLPPDFISEALGLPPLVPAYLDPAYGIGDFARGVCFASAGTGVDNATAGVLVSTARPASLYRNVRPCCSMLLVTIAALLVIS
uniref:GDSL esterase/lipase n=1 Tax=Aegilops tauschii subsp. strangulata TaxID=200361 RepID=A0A453NP91_AEGTS